VTVACCRAAVVWQRIRPFSRTSIKRNTTARKQDAFEGRASPDGDSAGNIPENVFSKGTACKEHACAYRLGKGASHLEDSSVGCAAKDSNGGWDSDCTRILIDAPNESKPTNVATDGHEVRGSEKGWARLHVGGVHVVERYTEVGGGRRVIISSIHLPSHLR